MKTSTNTNPGTSPQRRQRRSDQGGFTLLEAIIAMSLLTFGILAAAAMQGSAIRTGATAYERTEANNIAVALMETLQHLKFNNEALKKSTYDPNDDDYKDEEKIWADANPYPYDKDGGRLRLPAMLDELVEEVPKEKVQNFKKGSPCYFEDNDGTQITRGVVRDKAGGCYVLKWAVADAAKVKLENGMVVTDDPNFDPGSGFARVNKHIRVYLRWNTPYGVNRLQYTTIKYNNSTLHAEYGGSGGGTGGNDQP